MSNSLQQIARQHPFPGYQNWWPMGETFIQLMSGAIVAEWQQVDGDPRRVRQHTARYVEVVYQRQAREGLVDDFVAARFEPGFRSGEFDALSYAFFRAAFERMAAAGGAYGLPLPQARRRFTQRVGKTFFAALHDHLQLDLPARLHDENDLARLQAGLARVGAFLREQGYLRDHFAFTFEVDVTHAGQRITQRAADFLENLHRRGLGYALYEMGYPVILPSAVYLYHTLGEAQHHSSRTIEELFARLGCQARETDDFDPIGFPADRVVELWEIRGGADA